MATKIITYGNPILRMKAEEVAEVTEEIREIVKEMQEALAADTGVGLAAPQIGISKRIIIVDLTKAKESRKITLINPKITFKSVDLEDYEEGCLSVPGVWGNVSRPDKIRVKGKLLNGQTVVINAEGYFARVLQHEMDHLDGKLFIDHLSAADLELNRDKIDAIVEKNRRELGSVTL
jgi:peptide deformylase